MNRLMGIIGLCFLLPFVYKKFHKALKCVCFGYLFLIMVALLTSLVNVSFEEQFYMFLLTPLLNIGAGFFVCRTLGSHISIIKIIDAIIFVELFQAIISYTMFIVPSFNDFINSLVVYDDSTEERLNLVDFRLMGLGNRFFGAAANYGTALLLLALIPHLNGSIFYRNKLFYWVCITLIVVAGILSARTFMLVLIVLFVFVYLTERNILKILFKGLKVTIVLIAFFVVFMKLLGDSIGGDRFEHMQKWAFELFVTYNETGEFKSTSSDKVGAMYEIVPDNVITWAIGDAKYVDKYGYYKETDIGYFRHLFYWGIIGSVLYWIVVIIYYKKTSALFKEKALSHFFFVLFLWDVILNFKGIISMASFYLGPFLACGIILYYRNKKKTYENISNHSCLQC